MTRAAMSFRGGRALLIVLLALLVVFAAALAWYWMQPSTQPGPDEGRPVAEAFLTSLREDRAAEAWQSTTAEFKSAEGRESFLRYVRRHAFLKQPLEFISVQTVRVNEQPRSEYLYRAAEGESVRIVLGNEAGQWRVDRLVADP